VICSSRLDRKKNHLALVQAWAVSETLKNSANLVMIVRGSNQPLVEPQRFQGEQRQVLEEIIQAIEQHGLKDCLTAFELEGQAQLAAAYRHLAREHRGVFALTAVYEPFGLAPLEAMAAGLPVVATRNGGPAESLRDGQKEYGVLVDPEDPQDIARGIVRLTSDPEQWSRIQKAGRQRVQDRYTWARTAQGYLEQAKSLLAGQGAGDPAFSLAQAEVSDWPGGSTRS